jgi:hypothetical protein
MVTRYVRDVPPDRLTASIEQLQALTTSMRSVGLLLHREAPFSTELATEGSPANLAAVIANANALKALYNAHRQQTSKHIAADATNVVTSADATDQTTANTLLNEIKTDMIAHQALAAAHDVGPLQGGIGAAPTTISTANASDLATSQALYAALALAYNRHVKSGAPDLAIIPS